MPLAQAFVKRLSTQRTIQRALRLASAMTEAGWMAFSPQALRGVAALRPLYGDGALPHHGRAPKAYFDDPKKPRDQPETALILPRHNAPSVGILWPSAVMYLAPRKFVKQGSECNFFLRSSNCNTDCWTIDLAKRSSAAAPIEPTGQSPAGTSPAVTAAS